MFSSNRGFPGRDHGWDWFWVILGGVLMGLAPVPTGLWPLAWFGLVPLWRVTITHQHSGWRRFWLGAVWSAVYHGIVLSWITHLHPLTWMGIPWLASLAIALFAWAFITGLGTATFGLWAVLLGWCSDRGHLGIVGRLITGTALWCFLETLLSWGPLAWPFLAFTQSPNNLWALQLGQLAGPMTITAVIVAVNGCWAEASLQLSAIKTATSSSSKAGLQGWPFLLGMVLLMGTQGIGGALYNRPLSDRPETVLNIGLIQGNIPTRVKLTPAGTRQAIEAYAEGYRALVNQGADAVLTPEGAIPERWTRTRQVRSPIRQAVLQEGVVLWLGTFRPVSLANTRVLQQSLVNLNAQGQVTGQYNKVKLVPLGEYIPFEEVLGRLIGRLSPVSSSLKPGSDEQIFETPFGQVVIGICYESAYSDLFRKQTLKGGEWIMTASNNDPYPPRMMMQHHAQDVMRAVESDRWSVRATNTGISGIVTPRGVTEWLSQPNQYVTHLAQVHRRQTLTLYVRWGNWLTYMLLVISGIVNLRRVHKKPPIHM